MTPEEWEQVQDIIDRRPTIMKGNACPFYNLFHGLVYCATCGKSMQVRYEKVGRTGKNRFTGEMRELIDRAYYICQTYNRLGKNACTSHKIEARDLYNLVLKDIQELAEQAMKDADMFYQRLSSRMERRYLVDASQTEKERKRLEARNQEIDGMFLSLYTDKAKGVLTEQRFMKLTARRYRKSGSFITLSGKSRRLQHKNGKALPFMQGRAIFVNTSYLKILARTEKVTHNSENCRKISD